MIVDPKTGKLYDIDSQKGGTIINNYCRALKDSNKLKVKKSKKVISAKKKTSPKPKSSKIEKKGGNSKRMIKKTTKAVQKNEEGDKKYVTLKNGVLAEIQPNGRYKFVKRN